MIIPKDLNAEETAKRIFDDYKKFYELYRQNFGNEYEFANTFLLSNEKSITDEFVKRYNEMQKFLGLSKVFE